MTGQWRQRDQRETARYATRMREPIKMPPAQRAVEAAKMTTGTTVVMA